MLESKQISQNKQYKMFKMKKGNFSFKQKFRKGVYNKQLEEMRNCSKINEKLRQFGEKSAQQNHGRDKNDLQSGYLNLRSQNRQFLQPSTSPKVNQNEPSFKKVLTDNESTDKSSFSRKNSETEKIECYCQCHQKSELLHKEIDEKVKNKLKMLKSEIATLKQFKQQLLDEIDLLTMNFSFILQLASNNICDFTNKKFTESIQGMHRLSEKNNAEEMVELNNILETKINQINELSGEIRELKDKNSLFQRDNIKLKQRINYLEECLEQSSRKSSMVKQQSSNESNCSNSSKVYANEWCRDSLFTARKKGIKSKIYQSEYSRQNYGMEGRISTIKNRINQIQSDILKDIKALSHFEK